MKTEPHENAYPLEYETRYEKGLSKRELFAMTAMQGILANGNPYNDAGAVVDLSVKVADRLIEQLNK